MTATTDRKPTAPAPDRSLPDGPLPAGPSPAGNPNRAQAWRQWLARGSESTRIAYWKDVVCEAVLDVSMSPETSAGPGRFAGSILSRNVAGARLVNFRSSAHRIARQTRQADQSQDDCLMISLQCGGSTELEQRDQRSLLMPGDIGMLDSRRPFRITFPETISRRLVLMPRALLGRRGLQPREGLPMRIDAKQPTAPVIAQLLRTLTETRPALDEGAARVLLDALAELITRTPLDRADDGRRGPGRDSLDRVFDHVARNLASPTLSPAEAAADAGISLRTLHRLFQRHGGDCASFGAYVIAQRLDFARRLLASGRVDSVSDAAFRAGFNDLSHFNRRFKARYGIRPSTLQNGR